LLANALAVHLIRRYSTRGSLYRDDEAGPSGLSAPALRRATGYVEDNLVRDLSFAGLAEAACVDPSRFGHLPGGD
jgi:transcriptional regulator GlxA family with amidase domain